MSIPIGGNSANPIVSVFKDKFYRGADTLDAADLVSCEPLQMIEAVARRYKTDAHFAGYFIPGEISWPRLNKSILPIIRASGKDVFASVLAFDFDTPDHKPWGSETEKTAFLTRLGEAGEKCSALKYSVYYETRSGARTIHRLTPVLAVDVAEQVAEWAIERWRKYGIAEIDAGCSDWTRLFRLPYVVRDGRPTWEEELPCN